MKPLYSSDFAPSVAAYGWR